MAIFIEDLSVSYDTKPVLWDITCEIVEGSLTAIIGPNGAGKSTLLKTMLKLVKSASGSVEFSPHFLNNIAYMPQSNSVDWDFPITVKEVVLMGRYGKIGWIKKAKKHDKEIALQSLEKVGMLPYQDRQISQLSGGQQQRVFLARALAQEAQCYLMDEPFKGVDETTETTIITLLKQLQQEGKTIVVVHHDLQTVKKIFDHVLLMNVHLIACGEIETTFTDENLKKTYKTMIGESYE